MGISCSCCLHPYHHLLPLQFFEIPCLRGSVGMHHSHFDREQVPEILALVPRVSLLNAKPIQKAKVLLRNPLWPDGSGIHFQN